MIQITINDEPRVLDNETTLSELIAKEANGGAGVAVAVNDRLIRRPDWGSTTITDGDHITIIRAAYGG